MNLSKEEQGLIRLGLVALTVNDQELLKFLEQQASNDIELYTAESLAHIRTRIEEATKLHVRFLQEVM